MDPNLRPPSDFFRGVRLLTLDAGNTVIFLDHARLAGLLSREGYAVTPDVLIRAEGETKRLQETGELLDVHWRGDDRPGARGWGATMATMVCRAGVPREMLPNLILRLWAEHREHNFWSLVPDGLGVALDELRKADIHVALVSNSEGMLAPLFESLGIVSHFDLLLDSGIVGVEKPDARIFEIALHHFGVSADSALHVGDTFATDIVGAHAAGMRAALIDPHAHYAGYHLDIPRVTSVAEVARALLAERG